MTILLKYIDIDVRNGNEVNRLPIEKLNLDTIVLNEWMRADDTNLKM